MTNAEYVFRVATRDNARRDGELVLVNVALDRCLPVPDVAPTLQAALDDWDSAAPRLHALSASLDAASWLPAQAFDARAALSPLPRAYQWADASCYRHHAELMYRWRNEPLPPRYETEPLVYQGGSDVLLPPCAPLTAVSAAHNLDLEAEVVVITDDVPLGTSAEGAVERIALVTLINDVSLRALIPPEVSRGFGFYVSKPASHLAPVAATPGALGAAWRGAMLQRPVTIDVNHRRFGAPHAGVGTVFDFGQVIAHLVQTRSLCAGTIVGAGTISNADPASGSACITEARVRASLAGVPDAEVTPYLRDGDHVRIEAFGDDGRSLFGAIDQDVRIG